MTLQEEFFRIKDKIRELENDRKIMSNALRTKGEGEITATKRVYPGVVLEIKNITKEIAVAISNSSFYLQDGQIKQT